MTKPRVLPRRVVVVACALLVACAATRVHAHESDGDDDTPKEDARDTPSTATSTSTPAAGAPGAVGVEAPRDPATTAPSFRRPRAAPVHAMPVLRLPTGAEGKPLRSVHFKLPGMTADEEAQLLQFLADLFGKPVTQEVLGEATRRLAAIRKYKQVQCGVNEADVRGDEAIATCTIERARVLHEVNVFGLPAAILEQDVKKRVFLKPGEPLDEDDNTGQSRLRRQRARIEEFLEREGFEDAEVKLLTKQSSVAGEFDVNIRVRGGSFVRVRRVILKGFGPLSQRQLNDAYGRMCLTSEGLLDGLFMGNLTSCFNRRRLQATNEHFTEVLHNEGYPEARVHVATAFVDPRKSDDVECALSAKELDEYAKQGLKAPPHCVDLTVDIEQGTKVTARFHLENKHEQRPIAESADAFGLFGSTFTWFRETFMEPTSRALQLLARTPPANALDTQLVDTRLLETLSFQEAGAVDDTEVDVSRGNAEKYLAERGRVNPHIDVDSREFPGERVVDFNIAPSPIATVRMIRFVGNRKLATEAIEKEAELATKVRAAFSGDSLLGNAGTLSSQMLADDEDRIRNVYGQHGFPEANVQAVAEMSPPGAIDVTFLVDEGEQFVVSGVEFAGGSTLPAVTADVLQAIKNCQGGVATKERRDPVVGADCKGAPLRPEELEADAQRVQQVYAQHGFPDVEASIDTAFDKGGTRLRISVLPPHASDAEKDNPHANNVKQVVLAEVFLEGNHETRRDVLLREANLTNKDGMPLEPIALGKGISRLRRSGLYNSVELQYLGLDGSFGDDRTAIRLSVDERPAFTVDGSIGFSTEQLLTLHTEVHHKNLFGTMLDADWLLDFGLFVGRYSDTKAQIRWPRIFGSDISATFVPIQLAYLDTPAGVRLATPSTTAGQKATAAWEQPDLRRRLFSAGALLSLDWRVQNVWAPIDDKLRLGVALELRYDWLNPAAEPIPLFSQQQGQTLDGLLEAFTVDPTRVAALTPSISYNNVDNPFDPHEGVGIDLFVRASPWPPIVEHGPFGVAGVTARAYTTFFDRLTFAGGFRGRAGFSVPVQCAHGEACEWAVMQNDLLLVGGERSVRGVAENQVGVLSPVFDTRLKPVPETGPQLVQVRPGLYDGVLNLEARYTLIQHFLVGALAPAVFFDAGLSTDDLKSIDFNPPPGTPIDTRYAWSGGVGLRLVTPVGPLSIDAAYSPPRNSSAFYFTLGYIF